MSKQTRSDNLRRKHQLPEDELGLDREELWDDAVDADPGCCNRCSRWMQNKSYDWMASTIWNQVVSGFKPGRLEAIRLLDIQPDDKVLFVGEGSGLDFECLPDSLHKENLKAFDFSPAMVQQSKLKAEQFGIPADNCFVGDAQELIFTEEQFDKIYFPLSLASIPNPTLALQEAERVLAPGGKIVIFDKMLDDNVQVSTGRKALNLLASSIFADINRNLTSMLGTNSPFKIVYYESLEGQLDGFFANALAGHYRLAVLLRDKDYPDEPYVSATLS